MQHHKQVMRFEDENGRDVLEVDYCTRNKQYVLRCKAYLHLDAKMVKSLVETLQSEAERKAQQSTETTHGK